MPRLLGAAARPLFSAVVEGHGHIRVTARERLRRLWFVDGDGEAHLQTEVVCARPGAGAGAVDGPPEGPCTLDVRASLRRTPYLSCMARRLAEAQPTRVLVLGLGGGLLPMALSATGAVEVVVVERSALVRDLASRFFGMPAGSSAPGMSVHLCDAEEFVRARAPGMRPFDGCAIDVFESHSYRLPGFVLSSRFHSALRAALTPGARVVQNALAHSGHIEGVGGGLRVPPEEVARCLVRRRGMAPRGPLWRGLFLRRNEAAEQLAQLSEAFREAYGGARMRSPCPWAPSRVVEAEVG